MTDLETNLLIGLWTVSVLAIWAAYWAERWRRIARTRQPPTFTQMGAITHRARCVAITAIGEDGWVVSVTIPPTTFDRSVHPNAGVTIIWDKET